MPKNISRFNESFSLYATKKRQKSVLDNDELFLFSFDLSNNFWCERKESWWGFSGCLSCENEPNLILISVKLYQFICALAYD